MLASIAKAEAADNYMLNIAMDNGNELSFDMKQLFGYPPFIQLEDIKIWTAMKVNQYSVSWGEGSSKLELSIDTILNYFA